MFSKILIANRGAEQQSNAGMQAAGPTTHACDARSELAAEV